MTAFVGDNDHGESAPPLISRLLSLSHQAKKLLEGASDRVDPLYLNCMRRTEDECLSAAAYIKALREDLKASLEAHDDGINDALMEELWQRRTEMYAMKEQIKQLTNERDLARKMYCGVDNCTADEAMLLAKKQGWDCYEKEETQ